MFHPMFGGERWTQLDQPDFQWSLDPSNGGVNTPTPDQAGRASTGELWGKPQKSVFFHLLGMRYPLYMDIL